LLRIIKHLKKSIKSVYSKTLIDWFPQLTKQPYTKRVYPLLFAVHTEGTTIMRAFQRKHRFSVVHLIVLAIVLVSLVTVPMTTHAAPLNLGSSRVQAFQATKPPFEYKVSASVQKAFDLLEKYKIPASVLQDLIPYMNNADELTKVLKSFKSLNMSDKDISDFVAAAKALATDKKDPLTTAAYEAWVAFAAKKTYADLKIPTSDNAKLAVLCGAAPKNGEAAAPKSSKELLAAFKKAEPTLKDDDLNALMFYCAMGYDQVTYEVFEVFYLREELTYYGASPEVIKTIIENFDDQKAVEEELAKAELPADISKTMLQNYEEKLAELGPQACGCAAKQAIWMTAQALFTQNGVDAATQQEIAKLFEAGKVDEAGALAAKAGVPVEQLAELKAAIGEVMDVAKEDIQAFMAEQAQEAQNDQNPEEIGKSVDETSGESQPQEPADHPDQGDTQEGSGS
jgi:hypothetical protein